MHLGVLSLVINIFFLALSSEAKLKTLEWYGDKRASVLACSRPLYKSASFCNKTVGFWPCFCSNENALASILGCLAVSNDYRKGTINALKSNCQTYGLPINDDAIDKAYKRYFDKAVYPKEIANFNKSIPVSVPLKLNNETRVLYHKAYINYLVNNYDNSVWYSLMLVWWLTLVMIIASTVNLTKIFWPSLYMRLTGPISNNFRKYILLPATYGKNRNQELSWLGKLIFMLIPLRWETLVICVFLALNFVLLFANLYYVENDPLFPTKKGAFNKYVGDRSGIGGTMLTPMLVLFAGRNNILLWLTGWNYATNITFHKWVSRISFLLILIHSICYTVIFVGRGDYKEEMKETYLIWGTVGTAVMGLIMLQAMLQFRRRWYETFVLLHILLAVFYIIGCWYHLADLGYLQMIIPAIALWGFDRVARLVRMFIYGFPEACVTLLGNGNGIDPLTKEAATLKVVVPKSDHWRMSPGGHVWIYFLKPTCFWQSHPFTCIESLDGKSIILYCKVKSGVTYNLFKYLLVSPTKEAKIRVSVEGPYSEPCQYKRTECVSFIAGGNGIPGLCSEVTHLARKRQPSKGKLKLHWIIRDYGSIMWFYEQLEALKDVQVETTIYLTKPSQTLADFDSNKDTDDDDADKKSRESVSLDIAHLKSCLSHINFVEGKPLVDDIIRNDIEETSKSVAFVACGHPMMVDDARYAVVQSLTQNKGKRVDFYEALQVWT